MSKMSTEMKLRVTEIQRFCMHDGPGIRTTVFLKGCPIRCAWCHNPETQKSSAELLFYQNKCIGCGECIISCPQGAHAIEEQHVIDREKCILCTECAKGCPTGALEICGNQYTVTEILSVIEKDRAFYGNIGGVTLSGGEPFAQKASTVALLKACREKGFHTAVETCGYADAAVLCAAIPFVDLFLWDIKDSDDERHKKYTGASNQKILDNLLLADAMGANTRLRCILINGINTNEAHYHKIAKIASSLSHCEGVEWIPYHAYGGAKNMFLGGEDSGRKEWIPTPEQMEKAKEIVKSADVNLF